MILYLDVHSKKAYPANALSNFAEHHFVLDTIPITSMEGLLQSLKVPPEQQRRVCQMDARTAKKIGAACRWQETGAVFHWNGETFSRYRVEYWRFLKRAYDALTRQNADFAAALLATGHCLLWHSIGKLRRNQTCLTAFEFVCLLYRSRRLARRLHRSARP